MLKWSLILLFLVSSSLQQLVTTNVPLLVWPQNFIGNETVNWVYRLVVEEVKFGSPFPVMTESSIDYLYKFKNIIIWDTQWVYQENQSLYDGNQCRYAGTPLKRNTTYFWSVWQIMNVTNHEVKDGFQFFYQNTFKTSPNLISAQAEAKESVLLSNITSLYQGTLKSFYNRTDNDGYMNTSIGGNYTGLYTRDTSSVILALLEIGDVKFAEKVLLWMLDTFQACGIERAPHCTWKTKEEGGWARCIRRDDIMFAIGLFNFHDQVDGTMHLIIAFDRYLQVTNNSKIEALYYNMIVEFLNSYVGTPIRLSSYYNPDLRLMWNPGFEASLTGFNSYNLLSNLFTVEALRVMIPRVAKFGDVALRNYYVNMRNNLLLGIDRYLVYHEPELELDIYAFFRPFNYPEALIFGYSWVNYSPIPAFSATISGRVAPEVTSLNITRMDNTVKAYRNNGYFMFTTPTYPAELALTEVEPINHTYPYRAVIGKAFSWELAYAAYRGDWNRITVMHKWLSSAAGNTTLFAESYFYDSYINNLPYWGDIGNAEQAGWFLWAETLTRKKFGII